MLNETYIFYPGHMYKLYPNYVTVTIHNVVKRKMFDKLLYSTPNNFFKALKDCKASCLKDAKLFADNILKAPYKKKKQLMKYSQENKRFVEAIDCLINFMEYRNDYEI